MCALGGVSPDDFDFEAFSQHLNSHVYFIYFFFLICLFVY